MVRAWSRIPFVVVMVAALAVPMTAHAGPQDMNLLSHPGVTNHVSAVQVAPDGSRVLFELDHDGNGTADLFSAPVDGGPIIQLNTRPGTGGHIFETTISPDSRWVVYAADLDDAGMVQLYSAPIDRAGAQVELSSRPDPMQLVGEGFAITPDSTHVVFSGDLTTPGVWEMYSRPIDGSGSQVRLSSTSAGDVQFGSPLITPDSTRAVYTGDLDEAATYELYSAPIGASGQQLKLNDDPDLDGDVSQLTSPWLSPDGSRVVYVGDVRENGTNEVFSAPVAEAGQQLVLNDPPDAGGGILELNDDWTVRITPDGSRVVYAGDIDTAGVTELYSAPIAAAGGQLTLNDLPTAGGDVSGGLSMLPFQITPDSETVVFFGDLDTDGVTELYTAPVDAEDLQATLNGPTGPGMVRTDSGSIAFLVSPAGEHVAYVGDLDVAGTYELYARRLDRSGPQVKLSGAAAPTARVRNVAATPDGARVVYRFDDEADGIDKLFSAPMGVAGGQTQLSDDGVGPVRNFAISPDGRRVAYLGELLEAGVVELFSAPVDVAGQQVRLNDEPVLDGDVANAGATGYPFTPGSDRVVFRGDLLADGVQQAFATGRGQLAPRSPQDLVATAVTDTTVKLDWDDPAFGSRVDGHVVTVDPAPAGAPGRRAAVTIAVTGSSASISGLEPDTTYTARVTATNDAGSSPAATVEFTTASAAAPGGVHRLSGDDRYATAVAVALDRFDPAAVDTVYLAVGGNFPDALAGGPLAAQDGAPILLVRTDSLPEVVESALGTLGPSRVVALGGGAAISEAVLDQAAAAAGPGTATGRISGLNRYETAAAIAAALDTSGVDTAFLATGVNFPDALAGGPATGGAPILLTLPGSLPAATAAALDTLGPATVTALGGVAAVGDETLAAAAAAAGGAGTGRMSGDDRFLTATAIAASLLGVDTVYVAVGTNFPDALAAGPAAFGEGAPIVLTRTDALPDTTRTYIDGIVGLRRIVVLGGVGAVSDAVAAELTTLID